MKLKNQIFDIKTEQEFNDISIEIFNYQYTNNLVYNEFCKLLKVKPTEVTRINQIPFLPIEFFKTHIIKSGTFKEEVIFLSSGTTGQEHSKHYVKDITFYQRSYTKAFQQFYGNIEDYCILALLPSYLEREGSSLIYMVNDLIKKSKNQKSAFFLKNEKKMVDLLQKITKNDQKMILFGVSYALLDLAETHKVDLKNVIIIETGGMKGRREEITREELHRILCKNFNTKTIHSEYGMTELLSQAYSNGDGIFKPPNWMKILIRDINDPTNIIKNNKTGGINIIDLANIDSCSFIATQDLGQIINGDEFKVLGRFDNSDIRGCNLLIS